MAIASFEGNPGNNVPSSTGMVHTCQVGVKCLDQIVGINCARAETPLKPAKVLRRHIIDVWDSLKGDCRPTRMWQDGS